MMNMDDCLTGFNITLYPGKTAMRMVGKGSFTARCKIFEADREEVASLEWFRITDSGYVAVHEFSE